MDQSPKKTFKYLQIIHLSMVGGVSLVYVFLGNLQSLEFLKIPTLNNSALVLLLIVLSAVLASHFIYRLQLKKVSKQSTEKEKFVAYQNASIMRWAVLEGTAFLILFLNKAFLMLGFFIIIYLVFLKPSEDVMKRDFNNLKDI